MRILLPAMGLLLALSLRADDTPDEVLDRLASKDADTRFEAELALRRLSPEARAKVIGRLPDLPPEIAMRVWRVFLAQVPTAPDLFLPVLRKLSPTQAQWWRSRHGTAAGLVLPPEVLLDLAQSPSPGMRAWAAAGLARCAGEEERKAFLQLAADPSPSVRLAFVQNAPNAAAHPEIFFPFLQDASPSVRLGAVSRLAQARGIPTQVGMWTRLRDPDARIRSAATTYLLQTRAVWALPDLLGRVPFSDPRMKDVAAWPPMRTAVAIARALDRVPRSELPLALGFLERLSRRAELPGPGYLPVLGDALQVKSDPPWEGIEVLTDGHETTFIDTPEPPPPNPGHASPPNAPIWSPAIPRFLGTGVKSGWRPPREGATLTLRWPASVSAQAIGIGCSPPVRVRLSCSDDGETFSDAHEVLFPAGMPGDSPIPIGGHARAVRMELGSDATLNEVLLFTGPEDPVAAWKGWLASAEGLQDARVEALVEKLQDAAHFLGVPPPQEVEPEVARLPKHPVARWLLALSYCAAGKDDLAEPMLLDDRDRYAPAAWLQGTLFQRKSAVDDARRWFDRAVELDPRAVFPRADRAGLAVQRKDYAAAEADFAVLSVVAEEPSQGNPRGFFRIWRGSVLLELGRCEEAVAYIREGLPLYGLSPFGLYNLACGLARLRKTDLALAALEEAVKAGYADADWARKDSDLESLRADPRFEQVLKAIPAKPEAR